MAATPEELSLVGVSDFCPVLVAAAEQFAYYNIADRDLEGAGPACVDRITCRNAVRRVGFERLGGYRLTQLSQLKWQLTRIVVTWVSRRLLTTLRRVSAYCFCTSDAVGCVINQGGEPGRVFSFGFNNGVIRVLECPTMYVDRADLSGAQRTVRNDPRVTRIGWMLRALSIDEFPQLINVLRG